MRKVIGIGETILDIIFEGNQPSAAVPGGSVFNGIVSLGRAGVNVSFISETGNDRVGNIILQFMRENNIPTDHVNVFPDGKSPVSLAFLNDFWGGRIFRCAPRKVHFATYTPPQNTDWVLFAACGPRTL